MILRKIRFFVPLILLLLLNAGAAFAQGCEAAPPGTDPDDGGFNTNCPIDTWVYLLVAAALVFGAHQLNKKSKIEAVHA